MNENISGNELAKVAEVLGKFISLLHNCTIHNTKYIKSDWSFFKEFLTLRRNELLEDSDYDLKIRDYIPSNIEELYNDIVLPSILHGDINREHVYCYLQQSQSDAEIHPCGVIDFGDSISGDPIYELISIHIDIFRCDKKLLEILINSYGPEILRRENFSYRAMCYTLLHEQDALRNIYHHFPEWEDLELHDLEKRIWKIYDA